jgi:TRAP-type mannitol/chloroaromatic compound transport system permease small subunit
MIAPVILCAVLLLPLGFAFRSRKAEAAIASVPKAAFRIAAGAGLLLLLVQLTVVLLRSIFSVSFIWLQEATLYLFGAMFLLSSGALLLSEGHVRVDIFYAKASERRRALIDLVGMVVFILPLSFLIIIVSWNYVLTSWVQLERSQEASGVHAVFLLKTMIPLFAALLALAAEARIPGLVRQLRKAP